MSLQVQRKETMEKLGAARTAARELGLAITEANLKGDDATAREKQASFDKAFADVERLMKAIQNIDAVESMEAAAAAPTNALPLDPADAVIEGPPANGIVRPEVLARVREKHKRMQNAYLRFGDQDPRFVAARNAVLEDVKALPAEERQALTSTSGVLGGALVTEDFKSEVIKNLAGLAVTRASGVRVVPTGSDTLVFPAVKGGTNPWSTGYSGAWKPSGQGTQDGSASTQQNQPTFQNERIPVHEWQPDVVVVEPSLIEDSVAPLDSLLAEIIGETLALDEDYAFIRGTGQGQPKGLLSYVGTSTPADGLITTVATGQSGTLGYDGLVDLKYSLPAQYQNGAVYYMAALTMAKVIKLKDSSQMPMIYNGAPPNTIFGASVFLTEHMPALGASANVIIYGAPRYYVIAQRSDLRVQRLLERYAPNVGFLPRARVGGGCVRPAAFVIQQCNA